jgi:hypothetical protein
MCKTPHPAKIFFVSIVIPANAGIQLAFIISTSKWIPAFAGMTVKSLRGAFYEAYVFLYSCRGFFYHSAPEFRPGMGRGGLRP